MMKGTNMVPRQVKPDDAVSSNSYYLARFDDECSKYSIVRFGDQFEDEVQYGVAKDVRFTDIDGPSYEYSRFHSLWLIIE